MADRTRILLIDDHSLFREAIARLLGGEPDFILAGECSTVDEGLAIVAQEPVDIVLLDINLGLQQGGAFPALARTAGYTGKILVVTAGVSKVEAKRLRDRGCSGIVLKQERPQLLIERIRQAMSPEGIPPEIPSGEHPIPETSETGAPRFTARERQVLRGVFAGQSNKEIAFAHGISEPLVKAVIQQLFEKTGVRTRVQLVRVAIEKYWQDLEEEAEGA
ncbi:MAG: response regulator transcription factor [Bryobacteraceae bacterium]